jgi:hypothetical protein
MLAEANDVSQYTDLDAAARAAAVVETLDEIANSSAEEFTVARDAIAAGPLEQLRRQGATPEDLTRIEEYRARHADLYSRWTDLRLTPRELRLTLVDYYVKQGRERLAARFFPKP